MSLAMGSIKFFRKGTQVIATIDVITAVLTFITILFFVYLTITHGDRLESTLQAHEDEYPQIATAFALGRAPFVLIMLLIMSICVFYFFLARYLLHATYDRSHHKIRRWCLWSLVIIIIRAAFFITAVFFTQDRAVVSSCGVAAFLYNVLCLWFVRNYLDKLTIDNEAKTKFMEDLNNIEIQKSLTTDDCRQNETVIIPLSQFR